MAGKVAVMGLLERHGTRRRSRVRLAIDSEQQAEAHLDAARRRARRERARTVYTDALPSYDQA